MKGIVDKLTAIRMAIYAVEKELMGSVDNESPATNRPVREQPADALPKEMNVADPAGPERLKNLKDLGMKVLGDDGYPWIKDQLKNWGVKDPKAITIKHVADLTKCLAEIEKKQLKEDDDDVAF